MISAEQNKKAMENLIAKANAETGKSDTTLTSAVDSLIEGQASKIPEWDGSFTKIVNNLTGTTWEIASGWEAEAGSGQFEVNCTYEGKTYNRLGIGYGWEASLQAPFPFNNFALLYNEGTTEYAKMSGSNAYVLSITGGKDVGSATLQDWLLRYGKLQ